MSASGDLRPETAVGAEDVSRGAAGADDVPHDVGGEERFDRIDDVVRWTLGLSLAVGFVLLLVGVALVLAGRGSLPADFGGSAAAWDAFLDLRAEGFFAVGLLVVIMTPFVRVVGSVVAFAFVRDWRFVLVTLAVLGVMLLTIRVGVS
jgi:uncharacterized membrane protein